MARLKHLGLFLLSAALTGLFGAGVYRAYERDMDKAAVKCVAPTVAVPTYNNYMRVSTNGR